MKLSLAAALFLAVTVNTVALCPFSGSGGGGCPFQKGADASHERRMLMQRRALAGEAGDGGAEPQAGFQAVADDIEALLTDSQDFWPADFGNYGGLMIRLAWHCAGSYRVSDGRGGCDGGRIRFFPELNWPDNTNLDMALKLLEPIKEKYGSELSWGDLIMLTGTTAIKSMGGPSLGFCGGRIDDADGELSLPLGPTEEQRALFVCENDGECKFPFGQTTLGLIYVNPEGPMGVTDPVLSAADIRDSFGRMGLNDTEVVSLVGGGHAFGKCHGACSDPPCGDGKGPNTVTSGFEGAWSSTPTAWSNEYFKNILKFNYSLVQSPGGPMQWDPQPLEDGTQPPPIIMLTADLAMNNDPSYKELTRVYAEDLSQLEKDFSESWYRLATRDVGNPNRCVGSMTPDSRAWQQPLPDSPASDDAPDFVALRKKIQEKIDGDKVSTADLAKLAFNCAGTYRKTDHVGGCNGARIRFPPEIGWAENEGLDAVITKLEDIDRGDVSFADMIVLAGYTAVENDGGSEMTFCGNRVDASDAAFSENLEPRNFYETTEVKIKDDCFIRGFDSVMDCLAATFGLPTETFAMGEVFSVLSTGEITDKVVTMDDKTFDLTEEQVALASDAELRAVVDELADSTKFKAVFASGWVSLMNAGRYTGPGTNYCDGVEHTTLMVDDDNEEEESTSSATYLNVASVAAFAGFIFMW